MKTRLIIPKGYRLIRLGENLIGKSIHYLNKPSTGYKSIGWWKEGLLSNRVFKHDNESLYIIIKKY